MHELSVACQIVEAAITAAGTGEHREISAVHITMNADSHIDRGVLVDAFTMAATGTPAAAARLEVVPGSGLAVTAIEVC